MAKKKDRISGLPPRILQQILCFLYQEDAVRTCVLSKSWRHRWCTRPKLEFRELSFQTKEQKRFKSVVDKTLQRYHDQNLFVQELSLVFDKDYSGIPLSEAVKLLSKWVHVLKIFHIHLVYDRYSGSLNIPSSLFEAVSLEKLYLERCTLDQKCSVQFKHLNTLHLVKVHIEDETLTKIFSSCPLIESVTLRYCFGLGTKITVDDKLRNLKHFNYTTNIDGRGPQSIEFDIPKSAVIETIRISYCPDIWFRNEFQRNLKSLFLSGVRLSAEHFDFFSWNMLSLESLELVSCYGFEEFHLSSRSIKHFVFNIWGVPNIMAVTIDAPNILYFEYLTKYLPSIFSFTTTDHEWKSKVTLGIGNDADSSWSLGLYGLLKEISGSEISLFLCKKHTHKRKRSKVTLEGDRRAVAVEHLELQLPDHSVASSSAFLNELFDICHPRILVNNRNTGALFLKDLEEISMETHGRFRLKWIS